MVPERGAALFDRRGFQPSFCPKIRRCRPAAEREHPRLIAAFPSQLHRCVLVRPLQRRDGQWRAGQHLVAEHLHALPPYPPFHQQPRPKRNHQLRALERQQRLPPRLKTFDLLPADPYPSIQTNGNSSYALWEVQSFEYTGRMFLVKKYALDEDTAAGPNEVEYHYQKPVFDCSGAGFRGFDHTATYDPKTGHKLSETTPNGQTIAHQYDGFGRLKRTNYPDGNFTEFSYFRCTGADGCPAGGRFLHPRDERRLPNLVVVPRCPRARGVEKTAHLQGAAQLPAHGLQQTGAIGAEPRRAFRRGHPALDEFFYDELGREVSVSRAAGNRRRSNTKG